MKTKVFESALLRIYITFIKRQLLGIMGNVVIVVQDGGCRHHFFPVP